MAKYDTSLKEEEKEKKYILFLFLCGLVLQLHWARDFKSDATECAAKPVKHSSMPGFGDWAIWVQPGYLPPRNALAWVEVWGLIGSCSKCWWWLSAEPQHKDAIGLLAQPGLSWASKPFHDPTLCSWSFCSVGHKTVQHDTFPGGRSFPVLYKWLHWMQHRIKIIVGGMSIWFGQAMCVSCEWKLQDWKLCAWLRWSRVKFTYSESRLGTFLSWSDCVFFLHNEWRIFFKKWSFAASLRDHQRKLTATCLCSGLSVSLPSLKSPYFHSTTRRNKIHEFSVATYNQLNFLVIQIFKGAFMCSETWK